MKKTQTVEPHYGHSVQVCRDDSSLMKTLSQFVRDGLTASQPVIVIATPEHRADLAARLVADGLRAESLDRQGPLRMLDARQTLDSFMDGPTPDPEKFHRVIGSVLQLAKKRDHGAVRAYGEMVDLLWKEGNPEGAIKLEMLWNKLAGMHQFMLLCGYCVGTFYKQSGGFDISDVCHQHAHVLPA